MSIVSSNFHHPHCCFRSILSINGGPRIHTLWILFHFIWICLCWESSRWIFKKLHSILTNFIEIILINETFFSTQYIGNVCAIFVPCGACSLCNINTVNYRPKKSKMIIISSFLKYLPNKSIHLFIGIRRQNSTMAMVICSVYGSSIFGLVILQHC